eukprot:COSAG01_NODE_66_length_29241_cov_17.772768_13_plen_81_part_00
MQPIASHAKEHASVSAHADLGRELGSSQGGGGGAGQYFVHEGQRDDLPTHVSLQLLMKSVVHSPSDGQYEQAVVPNVPPV